MIFFLPVRWFDERIKNLLLRLNFFVAKDLYIKRLCVRLTGF